MEKRRSGHVVQITTSLADHAMSGVPALLASLTKGGLNAATKSLAIEYAKRGIRVNAVAPGIIKSPLHPVETHEALLDDITLYWLTNSATSSAQLYWENNNNFNAVEQKTAEISLLQ